MHQYLLILQQYYNVHFEPWVKANQLGGDVWIVDIYSAVEPPTHTKAVLKQWNGEDNSLKDNEVKIYDKLTKLCGQCIPKFIAVDIWEHSNSILTEYIKVSLLFSLHIDNVR